MPHVRHSRFLREQVGESRRKAEAGQVEALADAPFREDLLRKAVAKIQQERGREHVHFIERDAAIDAVQNDAVHVVAERAILILFPEIAVQPYE